MTRTETYANLSTEEQRTIREARESLGDIMRRRIATATDSPIFEVYEPSGMPHALRFSYYYWTVV